MKNRSEIHHDEIINQNNPALIPILETSNIRRLNKKLTIEVRSGAPLSKCHPSISVSN